MNFKTFLLAPIALTSFALFGCGGSGSTNSTVQQSGTYNENWVVNATSTTYPVVITLNTNGTMSGKITDPNQDALSGSLTGSGNFQGFYSTSNKAVSGILNIQATGVFGTLTATDGSTYTLAAAK